VNSFAKFHRRSLSDALEVAIARKAYHTGRGEHVALAGVEFVVPAGHEADGLSDQHCTRSDRRSARSARGLPCFSCVPRQYRKRRFDCSGAYLSPIGALHFGPFGVQL